MKIFTIFVAFFSTLYLFAQSPKLSDDFEVMVGEKYEETDGKIKLFVKYKEAVIAVNRHKDNLVIQKFNPISLKEIERKDVEKFFKDKRADGFIEMRRMKDNIYLFFSVWDKKNKTSILQYQKISLVDLSITAPKDLIKQKGKIKDGFLLKTTLKEDKLLVKYSLKSEIKNDAKSFEKISVNIFNNNLNLIWKNIIEMPYSKKKMEKMCYAIDSYDNFFMIAKIYYDDSGKDEIGRKSNFFLELFKVSKESDKLVKSKIDNKNKLIEEIILYEDINSNMIITGTTKNPDSKGFFNFTEGHSTGIFVLKLDKKGIIGNYINHDFSLEMLNKYVSKKQEAKNKKIKKDEKEKPFFRNLKIHTIVVNDDGSFLVLGEQYFKDLIISSSGKAQYEAYHYDDIMVAKINADGSLAWMDKLLKRQWGARKGTMSFTHMFSGEKHYLIYLDSEENLNFVDGEVPHKRWETKGGYFTVYIIDDETGQVTKEPIFDTHNVNGVKMEHFDTNKILSLSKSEILLEGFEGKKKDFLIKITAKSD
ncbi:hypothetical protein [uncultured Maribacter sp.]|uniref:hypothetical protein n=1 Tax=uncultured Maribacter sp. TaxID=431308 RepID=UPI00262EA7B8|nr:hypothetical protein [uncultured Maribacter sp.]